MNDDHDHDHANDNGEHERPGGKQVASAPAGGALTSLAALQTALANVPTGAYLGRTGLPMLLFKSRSNGAYMFGQRKTVPEPGSRWAVNPTTFMWGFVSFGANNKRAGEHLVPVGQPKPDITKLPDTGFPWQEEMAVASRWSSRRRPTAPSQPSTNWLIRFATRSRASSVTARPCTMARSCRSCCSKTTPTRIKSMGKLTFPY